jgi:F0F1-type ATP synthase assembly protein I
LNTPPDDRSALSRAIELGSLVTTIAMEMVVPILLGHWIDEWLGTKAVFAILGAALGMTGGLWHLIRLARQMSDKSGRS